MLSGLWNWLKKAFGSSWSAQIGKENISSVTGPVDGPVAIGSNNVINFTALSARQDDHLAPALSAEAKSVLVEAARSDHGRILSLHAGGFHVQVGPIAFCNTVDPWEQAKWRTAMAQLIDNGLIEDVGHDREVFRITDHGYAIADSVSPSENR